MLNIEEKPMLIVLPVALFLKLLLLQMGFVLYSLGALCYIAPPPRAI